jgi:hypothetical protein
MIASGIVPIGWNEERQNDIAAHFLRDYEGTLDLNSGNNLSGVQILR